MEYGSGATIESILESAPLKLSSSEEPESSARAFEKTYAFFSPLRFAGVVFFPLADVRHDMAPAHVINRSITNAVYLPDVFIARFFKSKVGNFMRAIVK